MLAGLADTHILRQYGKNAANGVEPGRISWGDVAASRA